VHRGRSSKHTGIAWNELFAAFVAVCLLGPYLHGHRLVLHIDNFAVAAIIRRGLSASPRLSALLRSFAAACHVYNVDVVAEPLLGVDNFVADFLSRPAVHGFASSPSVTHPAARFIRSVSVLRSADFRPSQPA
jgi:hypothetical protein